MTARSRPPQGSQGAVRRDRCESLAYLEKRAMSPAAWSPKRSSLEGMCGSSWENHSRKTLGAAPTRAPGLPRTCRLCSSARSSHAGRIRIEALLRASWSPDIVSAVTGHQLPTWLTHHNLEAQLKKARVVLEGHVRGNPGAGGGRLLRSSVNGFPMNSAHAFKT